MIFLSLSGSTKLVLFFLWAMGFPFVRTQGWRCQVWAQTVPAAWSCQGAAMKFMSMFNRETGIFIQLPAVPKGQTQSYSSSYTSDVALQVCTVALVASPDVESSVMSIMKDLVFEVVMNITDGCVIGSQSLISTDQGTSTLGSWYISVDGPNGNVLSGPSATNSKRSDNNNDNTTVAGRPRLSPLPIPPIGKYPFPLIYTYFLSH